MKKLPFFLILSFVFFVLAFLLYQNIIDHILEQHPRVEFKQETFARLFSSKILFSLVFANIPVIAYIFHRKKAWGAFLSVTLSMLIFALVLVGLRVFLVDQDLNNKTALLDKFSNLMVKYTAKEFRIEYFALAGVVIGFLSYELKHLFKKKKKPKK